MAYVIGIDTGGTYTDAVLLDKNSKGSKSIKKKVKAFTTHENLEIGISQSIENLNLSPKEKEKIEKVVLSTTLATNATVEGKLKKMGLILIGNIPCGELATPYVKVVRGMVNIKGRVLVNLNRLEVEDAVRALMKEVDSIAVSGSSSVRNPELEQGVRNIIHELCDLPVVCGHELVSDLGFLERTNTAVINAGLLPIISNFVDAIKKVLTRHGIDKPVFVVKGDGSITKIDAIKKTPVDTVLSGPASSIIGAINLSGVENAVVADMGGTTTDIGVVKDKKVELSPNGANIGNWSIKIKSAKLYTFGLGGDSNIRYERNHFKVGPERVLPACRGGDNVVTPTDLIHCTGEYRKWDYKKSDEAVVKQANSIGITEKTYLHEAYDAVAETIEENISLYDKLGFPICAIGAPAETWYGIAQRKYGFDLIVPEHYEVANAVGAATAGSFKEVNAIVRPGEGGFGFLVHTPKGRISEDSKDTAIMKAIMISKECAVENLVEQDLEIEDIQCICEEMYTDGTEIIRKFIKVNEDGTLQYEKNLKGYRYLNTRINVIASGKIFSDDECK